MAFTHELKKTVTDATPVYAVVGVTDLAAEKLRAARTQARTQAAAAGKTITAVTPKTVQKQVQDVPAVVLERSLELAGKAPGRSTTPSPPAVRSWSRRSAPRSPPRTSSRRPSRPSRSARAR